MADTVGKRLVMVTEVDGEIVEVAMRDYFELIRMHATAINHGDGLPVAAITADDDPLELRKARVTERRRKALARAVDVLGSREKALHWLRSRNRAMGGSKPNALVERDEGLKQVEEVLGRIEYGVYS